MNMKNLFGLLVILLWAASLPAQTNSPVRLAIVPETPQAAAAADLLTAEFSQNRQVQLLERADIERVYREQGLSAANRDDQKLGQFLGADGLLLLNIVSTPLATNMTTRLIAVKPGVVLTDGSIPWPAGDMAQIQAALVSQKQTQPERQAKPATTS